MSKKPRQTDQPPARGTSRDEDGFTILETMIALLVLMIVLLGAAATFTYAINYSAGGAIRAEATKIASAQIEILRETRYVDLPITPTPAPQPILITGSLRSYSVMTTITSETSTTKKIVVTCAPQNVSQGWAASAITLITYRSAGGKGSNYVPS